jgi:hypothetical protein
MAFVTIANMNFVVMTEHDPALMHTPTQFVFYRGQRVGLYLGACIYFMRGPMEDAIGQDFNVQNFPQALNFFRFNYDGLTPDMIYNLNSRLNNDIRWADSVLAIYRNRDL